MRERDTAALNERCNAQLELSAVVRLWFSENESSHGGVVRRWGAQP